MLKAAELLVERWQGSFLEVVVMGEGQLDTAVLGKLLQNLPNPKEEAGVVPSP